MSLVAEFIGSFLLEVLWALVKRLGSLVRWIFLRSKHSYHDIYKQDWNGRVGFFTIVIATLLVIGMYSKFFKPQQGLDHARTEIIQAVATDEIKDGDIIFQTSLSSQSKAIQLATQSAYSHCGIIYKENGQHYVFEAIQPVKTTPLDQWIARGENQHFVIKRLKNANQILTDETLQKMKTEGEKFKGKNYDLTFEWSDDNIYCSELIWKIYQRATGIEIGKLETLRDFDLTHEVVIQKMKERYGDKIPMDEIVISPQSIFESDLLETILDD